MISSGAMQERGGKRLGRIAQGFKRMLPRGQRADAAPHVEPLEAPPESPFAALPGPALPLPGGVKPSHNPDPHPDKKAPGAAGGRASSLRMRMFGERRAGGGRQASASADAAEAVPALDLPGARLRDGDGAAEAGQKDYLALV